MSLINGTQINCTELSSSGTITTTGSGLYPGGVDPWVYTQSYPRYEPTNTEVMISQIMREELRTTMIDLDMDKIQSLLKGTKEDCMIAVELLKGQTKYIWRIIHELKVNNTSIENTGYIVRDYLQNNIYGLNLDSKLL